MSVNELFAVRADSNDSVLCANCVAYATTSSNDKNCSEKERKHVFLLIRCNLERYSKDACFYIVQAGMCMNKEKKKKEE